MTGKRRKVIALSWHLKRIARQQAILQKPYDTANAGYYT
jgi:hypothetical protein